MLTPELLVYKVSKAYKVIWVFKDL